jgi:hypothetical protein
LFHDQKLLLSPLSKAHAPHKNQGPVDVLYITENYGSMKHNTEYPSTSSPGISKSDVPTPRGSQQTIRIRLPRHFTEPLADILVLDICVTREGQVDCSFTSASTRAHINEGFVRHTAPDRIIRRIQEWRVVSRPSFEGVNGSNDVNILWGASLVVSWYTLVR